MSAPVPTADIKSKNDELNALLKQFDELSLKHREIKASFDAINEQVCAVKQTVLAKIAELRTLYNQVLSRDSDATVGQVDISIDHLLDDPDQQTTQPTSPSFRPSM